MERYDDLVQLFEHSTATFRDQPLFGTKRAPPGNGSSEDGSSGDGSSGDGWIWQTYGEVADQVAAMRSGLHDLGVSPGDRIAIVSNNCVEWAVLAFAAHGLGAAIVPMYEVQPPSEWRFIIGDSGAKLAFTGGAAIARALRERPELEALERVVDLDDEGPDGYAALLRRGRATPRPSRRPDPGEVASLVYTSGTTGRPKGVLLTHSNIASNLNAIRPLFPFGPDDRSLSFLPWAHSFGQTCELFGLMSFGCSTAINDRLDHLMDNLAEVRPTVLVAVPRIFNRLYERIDERIAERPAFVRRLLRAGVAAGAKRARGEALSLGERLAWTAAYAIVFRMARHRLGGRLRYAVSGSAALDVQVAELIDAIGVTVYEGYGLSETSPIVSVNAPGHRRLGSVGRVIEGVHVAIDEAVAERAGEGEILVRGPNVMKGYHNLPEETREAFTADGAFRTGDLGYLDDDGFLFITGRIKEQYKLETGKYVMPAVVEEQLELSPYIAAALVFGDNRPFNVALLVPDLDAFGRWWARGRDRSIDDGEARAALEALLADEVERHGASLKPFERPRRFAVLSEGFTPENGLATPTLKLRRHRITQRYAATIQRLYEEAGRDASAARARAADDRALNGPRRGRRGRSAASTAGKSPRASRA